MEVSELDYVLSIIHQYPVNAHSTYKRLEIYSYIDRLTTFLDTGYEIIDKNQRMWHIKNRIMEVVLCPVCENPRKWNNGKYLQSCGDKKCSRELSVKGTDKTKIIKYGSSSNINSVNEIKARETNLKNYGVEFTLQDKEIRERIYKTNIEKYGFKSTAQNPIVKAAQQATLMENHGVDCYFKTEDNWKKFYAHYDEKLRKKIGEDYEFIERVEPYGYRINHKICGKEFIIDGHMCKDRCRRKSILCLYCNKINTGFSGSERIFADSIASIYDGEIITNTWRIISPYELDIYIPEKKIAIEYHGDYWHANPKIYSADYKYPQKKRTAQDIWDQDAKKKLKCDEMDIKLIIVWESDWKENKDGVLDSISYALNKILL